MKQHTVLPDKNWQHLEVRYQSIRVLLVLCFFSFGWRGGGGGRRGNTFFAQYFYRNTYYFDRELWISIEILLEYDCYIFSKYLGFQMKNLVFQSKYLVIRSRTLDFGRNTYEIRLSHMFKIPRISNEKPSILIEILGILK